MSLLLPALVAALHLNELMASNAATARDGYGQRSDWVEIVNAGPQPVSLAGWSLSDDPADPGKWAFPEQATIQSGEFLLVWCSGTGGADSQGRWHTTFRLNKAGETILLIAPDGAVADAVTYDPLPTDRSQGRTAQEEWRPLESPTPGAANAPTWRILPPPAPAFDPPATVRREAPLRVRIASHGTSDTLITWDGSDPLLRGEPLGGEGEVVLDHSAVLRAVARNTDGAFSDRAAATYLLGQPARDLATVSLSIDPENWTESDGGIWVEGNVEKRGLEWERPAHVEFFDEAGRLIASRPVGVRVHGGSTRRWPKRSLRLAFRGLHGAQGRGLEADLLPGTGRREFDQVVLRMGGGSEWMVTMLREGLMQELAGRLRTHGMATRPAVVYVNGEYLGLYDLRERVNEKLAEARFGIADPDLVAIEFGFVAVAKAGDLEAWNRLQRVFETADFTQAETLRRVERLLDLDDFTDHTLLRAWGGDIDWPHNNWYFLRDRATDGPFRTLAHDMDGTLGYFDSTMPVTVDSFQWILRSGPRLDLHPYDPPEHARSTWMLRRLLENEEYRRRFATRALDLLNTEFAPERTLPLLSRLRARIAEEAPRDYARWGLSEVVTPAVWERNVETIADFLRRRGEIFRSDMTAALSLPEAVPVTIRRRGAGRLRVNTVEVEAEEWTGFYVPGLPVMVEAIPALESRFAGWSGRDESGVRLTFDPATERAIEARFEERR